MEVTITFNVDIDIKSIKLDLFLAICSTVEDGVIVLTTESRSEIMERLSLSKQGLSNGLSKLRELNLISPKANGEYYINPYLIWVGDELDRLEFIFDNRDIMDIWK